MLVFIFVTAAIAATLWMLLKVNSLDPYAHEEMRSFMVHGFAIQRRVTKVVVLAASLFFLASSGAAWIYSLKALSILVAFTVCYLLVGVIAVALKAPKLKFNRLSSDQLLQSLALVPTWPVWLLGSKPNSPADGVCERHQSKY